MLFYELCYRHVGSTTVYTRSYWADNHDDAVDQAVMWLNNTEAFLGVKLEYLTVYLMS